MKDEVFLQDSTCTLDKISSKYDNFIIMGDLNYNLKDDNRCKPLDDLCDIFDLSNIIKGDTYFPKDSEPSQIDVVLSNNHKIFPSQCNFNCGISDIHIMLLLFSYMERYQQRPPNGQNIEVLSHKM
jgi:endonuclease/exonuclease/phosphatase family metal-dependent hydrolase